MRCTDLVTDLSVSFPGRWMKSPVFRQISDNCSYIYASDSEYTYIGMKVSLRFESLKARNNRSFIYDGWQFA